MDSSSIELPGSKIDAIELDEGVLRVRFSRAMIIKTMTGSTERTRWWQAGDLVIAGAEVDGPLPEGPLVCAGGDLDENIYTYRDMIPIPLASRGQIRCTLRFDDGSPPLGVMGESVGLELLDVPKYIEHIR